LVLVLYRCADWNARRDGRADQRRGLKVRAARPRAGHLRLPERCAVAEETHEGEALVGGRDQIDEHVLGMIGRTGRSLAAAEDVDAFNRAAGRDWRDRQ